MIQYIIGSRYNFFVQYANKVTNNDVYDKSQNMARPHLQTVRGDLSARGHAAHQNEPAGPLLSTALQLLDGVVRRRRLGGQQPLPRLSAQQLLLPARCPPQLSESGSCCLLLIISGSSSSRLQPPFIHRFYVGGKSL
jgi:hypothetical protein